MPDGPIYRTPDELAEYFETHRAARIDAGATIIPANTVRARLTQAVQDRIDQIIHRESELGTYALEDVRELGKHAI
jgi:hypothetical protein